MRGVLFLLRSWARHRRAALAAVALVASASMGLVLTAGLGARRAAISWDRLRSQALGEDLLLDVQSVASAHRVAERVRAVPGVDRASAAAFGFLTPEGREDFFGGVIMALDPGGFDRLWRPVLSAGRHADGERVDEVVINDLFLSHSGLGVGDTFTLMDPIGLVRQPVTIVGVGMLPSDFTFASGSAIAYPTPAFSRAWAAQIQELFEAGGSALVGPSVLVAGAEGVGTAQLATAIAEAIPDGDITGVNAATSTGALVVSTLDLQRNGYLALCLVGGVAALAAFALMLARVTHVRPTDALALSSVGFSRRDLQFAVLLPGGALALASAVVAVAMAAAAETHVPTGLARHVGAGRRLGDDGGFLALGGAISALALAAVVAVVAWRSGRTDGARSVSGRRRATFLAWPSVAAGVRAAAGGLSSAGRRQAAAGLATVAIACMGIAAVAVVTRSRDGLSDDLTRVGKFYDVVAGFYSAAEDVEPDRDALSRSTSVRDVATIEFFTVAVDDVGAAAITVTGQRGGTRLRLSEGRPAVGDDEVVASAAFLRRLHHSVGDVVKVSGEGGTHPFRVVGSTVLPLLSPAGVPGEQLAFTAAGRRLIGAAPEGYALGIKLADAGPVRTLARASDAVDACDTDSILPLLGVEDLRGVASGVSLCAPKGDIRVANIEELGGLPRGVVGSFAAMAAVGLTYLLSSSYRRSRQELSVLRALGFTRRQSMTSVLAHAGTLALLGTLLALPFGVALGRTAWRAVAEGADVAVVPEVSFTGTAGLVIAGVAVAVLLAIPFAVRSVARPPAAWLRAE